jgi:Tfp pilus assembly protein PilW
MIDVPDSVKSQHGISLIEMVVAMSMAVVITGAAVSMMVSVLKSQPDLTERSDQVGKSRVGVDRFVREIRQGVVGSVKANTAAGFEFETYVDSKCGTTTVSVATKCKVVYACASEKCTRTTGPTGATSSVTFGEKIKNPSAVFEYVAGTAPCSKVTGEPITFVAVKLEMRSQKGGVTTLQDGAGLRSCS